ncbi:conjugal transfer protein TraP [Erwinia amylovora]|uniref:conjugal transfer protein TraP n=1 Tax=Erwinia amylovora TaxID=552 RepID=UPI000C07FBF9|nr:conjugal transfer protein TraP [Erwinia amylovora]
MSEFDTKTAESEPIAPAAPTPAPHRQSILTRPVFLGYSLPWLTGIFLVLGGIALYLFLPGLTSPDAGQRAFGQDAGLMAVQSSAVSPAVPQTGGLSIPTTVSAAQTVSVPDDVLALIHEGREFEAANREAITRLSDTVRAQTKALAALQQQLSEVEKENARLGNLVTVLAVRPAGDAPGQAAVRKGTRSALAGLRLESLQEGMAWVSWQGRTYAVQPGESLGGVTVRDINTAERSVTTSAGVLR